MITLGIIWFLFWLGAYGQWVYYFQTKYDIYDIAHDHYWEDRIAGGLWALAGPIAFVVALWAFKSYRGWKL
jgi:hypothetical protein